MVSFGSRLAAAGGRPAGFDYLRIGLATLVVLHHSYIVTLTPLRAWDMWSGADRMTFGFILPMFFALSGFLVTGSLERTRSILGFLGLRAIRLAPALVLEVLLSALLLGPIFTKYSLSAYFSHPEFFSYLRNLYGDVHYFLPGVFTDIPEPAVNAQLWTIPFELKCYAVLGLMAFVGGVSGKWPAAISMIALQIALVVFLIVTKPPYYPFFHGKEMVACFCGGVLLYKFADHIPSSGFLAVIAVFFAAFLLRTTDGDYFLYIPVSYLAVYLGAWNPPRVWIVSSGDYSYGLYLFSFPIQQAMRAMNVFPTNPLGEFLAAFPVSFAFAYLSWHLVEKRALRLRPMLEAAERWALRIGAVRWHSESVFRRTAPRDTTAAAAAAGPAKRSAPG